MSGDGNRFYGKYRGTVTSNQDPLQTGRLQVQVPDVLGSSPSTWAMPCFPAAGQSMGIHALPPVGAGVWVEFEQGDPDYPIWTGSWWGSASEVPDMVLSGTPGMPNIVLQTSGKNMIVISDLPGGPGITLKLSSGAQLVINDTGIEISNGKGASISLSGSTVNINQGALTVT